MQEELRLKELHTNFYVCMYVLNNGILHVFKYYPLKQMQTYLHVEGVQKFLPMTRAWLLAFASVSFILQFLWHYYTIPKVNIKPSRHLKKIWQFEHLSLPFLVR